MFKISKDNSGNYLRMKYVSNMANLYSFGVNIWFAVSNAVVSLTQYRNKL